MYSRSTRNKKTTSDCLLPSNEPASRSNMGTHTSGKGYATRKPSSITNTCRTLQQSCTISTGVLKPAPVVPTPTRLRTFKNHQVDLRFDTPPPTMEKTSSECTQICPQASCSQPQSLSVSYNEPLCKNPDSHPGSNSRQPRNEFVPQRTWLKGPADPSGMVVNLSDRPSLCMSIQGKELAIGSSDHAVYTLDIGTCELTRILYGKSYGHTEWVTCVDHLPDGRIISGGMDNKLCLWDKRGVRSRDLKGHCASVSSVKAGVFNHNIAVSSSYDRTLILWDLGGVSGREVGRLTAHKAAVMEFEGTCRGRLVSGCRDGTVILWDVNTITPVLQCKNAHKGHVTALQKLEDESGDLFLTGGQDGLLQGWDFRCKKPVHTVCLHRSPKGIGALSCISVTKHTTCGCPLITTAGADRLLKVLDVRASFNVVHTLEDHKDFIYSLYMNGSLAWSGGGDGSLLVHDVERGECLYGLGAIRNGAVRGISLAGEAQDKLVATGDDGNVMIYSLA